MGMGSFDSLVARRRSTERSVAGLGFVFDLMAEVADQSWYSVAPRWARAGIGDSVPFIFR
jgi:hypothetical protein